MLLAAAFACPVESVRRANMLLGDIGTAALLARSGTLDTASLKLFRPIAFMLAQPEEVPERIIEQLGEGALADDKYDGIRAQIHFDGSRVGIYSRTLDEVTSRFPELAAAAGTLPADCILDGEIVAWRERILPFATLQPRLGRRKPSERLLRESPVVFFAFDLLYAEGEPLLEVPLSQRLERLQSLLGDGAGECDIRTGFQTRVRSAGDIERAFDDARKRANEGLVVKDPRSLYTPGRRGKAWLKLKKALATLDCVVTAVERGHGRRRDVLSDYTFAIRSGKELLNIGKAYSGLKDREIEELTRHFESRTVARYGPVRVVEPDVVVEIAFDRIQESKRHKSGYSSGFPASYGRGTTRASNRSRRWTKCGPSTKGNWNGRKGDNGWLISPPAGVPLRFLGRMPRHVRVGDSFIARLPERLTLDGRFRVRRRGEDRSFRDRLHEDLMAS